MSKEHEYRRYAAVTLALAQRANSNADKSRLLVMADAWLDLADRAYKARSVSEETVSLSKTP